MTCRRPYDTDLTDREWEQLKPLVPLAKPGGRPPIHSRREILNGIFYAVRSGCAWKLLPHDLPPWRTVYHYFWLWRRNGTWQRIMTVFAAGILMDGCAVVQNHREAGVTCRSVRLEPLRELHEYPLRLRDRTFLLKCRCLAQTLPRSKIAREHDARLHRDCSPNHQASYVHGATRS
jgi:transposase